MLESYFPRCCPMVEVKSQAKSTSPYFNHLKALDGIYIHDGILTFHNIPVFVQDSWKEGGVLHSTPHILRGKLGQWDFRYQSKNGYSTIIGTI